MRRAGLTLIEVLLAVLILSLGVTVLLVGASRCLAVMKLAQNVQDAQWTLDRAEAEHPILTNDVESLRIREEYGTWTYEREPEDDEDEDGLFVVRSRVSWSSRGRQKSHEVVSYVLRLEEEKK